MNKPDDLAEKLIAQNGHASEEAVESQLMRIQQSVQNEGKKLRHWMWNTASLWIASFIFQGLGLWLAYGPNQATHGPGGGSEFVSILLTVVCGILPILALISTLILIFWFLLHLVRVLGSGRTEANLRLKMIEERLRQMDRKSEPQ